MPQKILESKPPLEQNFSTVNKIHEFMINIRVYVFNRQKALNYNEIM